MTEKTIAISQLNNLKMKAKFEEDNETFYPGIERLEIRKELSALINVSIDNFINDVENNASEKEYQETIEKGLKSFDKFDLDTEDRERVCMYFEEMMDAVGLESSGGVINTWLYGFDM